MIKVFLVARKFIIQLYRCRTSVHKFTVVDLQQSYAVCAKYTLITLFPRIITAKTNMGKNYGANMC